MRRKVIFRGTALPLALLAPQLGHGAVWSGLIGASALAVETR